MGTHGMLLPTNGWHDYSGLLFTSIDEVYQAVQDAAFAQGYAIKRARTSREKRTGDIEPTGPLVRLDMRCVCAGQVGKRIYRTKSQKTGCPFKAIASVWKSQGSRWVLRVVDGRHNHPPEAWLVESKDYRAWFRRRIGGANELERMLATARMTVAMFQPVQPPEPLLVPMPEAMGGAAAGADGTVAGSQIADMEQDGQEDEEADVDHEGDGQDTPSHRLGVEVRGELGVLEEADEGQASDGEDAEDADEEDDT